MDSFYTLDDMGIISANYRLVSPGSGKYPPRMRWWKYVLGCLLAVGAITLIVVELFCANCYKNYLLDRKPDLNTINFILVTVGVALWFVGCHLFYTRCFVRPRKRYYSFDYVQNHKLVKSRYLLFIQNRKWGVCDARRGYKVYIRAKYDSVRIVAPDEIIVTRHGAEKSRIIPGARFSNRYEFEKQK